MWLHRRATAAPCAGGDGDGDGDVGAIGSFTRVGNPRAVPPGAMHPAGYLVGTASGP
ncbi:hypothetical protein CHAN_03470 [Corynebacterium hansenii]|nr:hypothetical protein CHAN_03470 [Corynebacterium hansenii]